MTTTENDTHQKQPTRDGELEGTPRRVIAIVGRPNVGKSALFNRLVGRRMAIVHEESGVTRDRLAAQVKFNDEPFEIIDTGGLALVDGATTDNVIEQGIRKQVDVALQDAAVVLFIVDTMSGLVPLDEQVARELHQSGVPVLLATNKSDNESLASTSTEFQSLGFPVFPISALHNLGIHELLTQALKHLPEVEATEEQVPLKIAVLGRPNVGKSSYVNSLIHDERTIVSDIPGTTRDSIEVPMMIGKGDHARHYLLIDTAGIRRLGKVDSVVERFSLFRTETSIAKSDIVVLLIDAEQGPTAQDKKIANKIVEHEKGCAVFVNKWDLAMQEKIDEATYAEALIDVMPFLRHTPILFMSALSGYNLQRSVETINYVASQVDKSLSTGTLNRVLHDAFQRVQPPLVKNMRLKLYYATQTGKKPIRISLFVNNPKRLVPAYKGYLIKQLRAAFGLEGAPIVLLLRRSHKARGKY